MTVKHVYWLRDAERPDVDCYLREVAAFGVEEVFVGGYAIAEICPYGQVATATLARALADTGTRIHTIHALFGGDKDLGVADESERSRGVASHTNALRVAARLGARNMVFHIGGLRREAILANVLRSVEELLPVAEEAGVDIAIENLPPGFLGSEPEDLAAILDAFESPRLGICLDTGHANLTGGCDRWLDAIGEQINMVHLHDNAGDTDSHLPPGMGTIDWPRLQKRLRACGYDGPWVSETRMYAGWTPEQLVSHFEAVFA
jgi:sugar phosphate isomerase/epimerase